MKAKQDLGPKDQEPRFIKRRLDPFVICAGHGSSSRLTIPTSVCAASAMAAKLCAPEVAMAGTPAARSARFARSNYVPLDNLDWPCPGSNIFALRARRWHSIGDPSPLRHP